MPLFQEQLLRMAMVAAGFTGGQAEELRRAIGFKRSERRMKQIEVQLREGMARKGITGKAADEIVLSITSFALYGFPESHAASFALLVYASAYLKAHYPAAFYAALLNNQPMGFYHPATLVKDAQRHGVRFAPVDVQRSDWACTIEPDGTVRLGLALRGRPARAGGAGDRGQPRRPPARAGPPICPKCRCDDASMLEVVAGTRGRVGVLQQLRARLAAARRSLPLGGRPGGAHRDQPRGAVGARRDRRAQRVRPHAARGAVAGGTGHPPGGGAVSRNGTSGTRGLAKR